jgi:hypothetical protein
VVKILVGDEACLWVIHSRLLCASSKYFEAATRSLFREGVEKEVVLKEENNEVFSLFVQWLYSGTFTTISLDLLLRAYVLGDRFGSHGFQTLAFDKIYSMNTSRCSFTADHAVWVSENTIRDSTLRKFTMDTLSFGLLNGTLQLSDNDRRLLASNYLDILRSIQEMASYQFKNWTHRPRFHYNPVI